MLIKASFKYISDLFRTYFESITITFDIPMKFPCKIQRINALERNIVK